MYGIKEEWGGGGGRGKSDYKDCFRSQKRDEMIDIDNIIRKSIFERQKHISDGFNKLTTAEAALCDNFKTERNG